MFQQILTPPGHSLGRSFMMGSAPAAVVLQLAGVLRHPAWRAALAGLIAGLPVHRMIPRVGAVK